MRLSRRQKEGAKMAFSLAILIFFMGSLIGLLVVFWDDLTTPRNNQLTSGTRQF